MLFYTREEVAVNLHNLSAQESGSDKIPGLWENLSVRASGPDLVFMPEYLVPKYETLAGKWTDKNRAATFIINLSAEYCLS